MNDEHELAHAHVPVNAGGRTPRGFLPGIRFETALDGSGGGGGGGAAADAGAGVADAGALANGAGAGTAADAGTEQVTPGVTVDFSDPAVLDQLATNPRFLEFVDERTAGLAGSLVEERLGGLEAYLRELGAGAGDGGGAVGETVELNPWDPNFGATFAQLLQQEREQMLGEMRSLVGQIAQPLAQREQQEHLAEGEQRLSDMLADDIARNGDFPRMVDPATGQPVAESKAEKLVIPFARMLFPQIQERFGATPRAAEIAVSRAAGIIREIVAEGVAANATAEQNRLAALNGTRVEPGGGVIGVQTLGEIKAASMEEGLSAVTARHRAALRAGAGQ